MEYGAQDQNANRWYYASGLDNGGQVWRSGDRGVTWTKLNPPLGTSFQNGLEIAASKLNKDTVYLLAGTLRKVYKSIDAGDSWTDITTGFPNGSNNYNWSQSSYDFYIETSTRQIGTQLNDVLYVGLIDIVQSPDAGATWQSIGQTYTNSALTHNDQHAIRAHFKDANQIYVCNDGGIYGLSYEPTLNAWSFDTSLNRRLGIELGCGARLEAVVTQLPEVPEGIGSVRACRELARRHGLRLPIAEAVAAILEGDLQPVALEAACREQPPA